MSTSYIKNPFNYTGGKEKLLSQILPLFPNDINIFIDLFCGGCSVGANVESKATIFNDSSEYLIAMLKYFHSVPKKDIIDTIYKIINHYDLSLTSKHGYKYYNCNSSSGLSKYNKDKFNKLRDDFNRIKDTPIEFLPVMLYVIILYAFNNQMRFNGKGEFNMPVGKGDFNKSMETKLIEFIDRIQANNYQFICTDFRTLPPSTFTGEDFVYADPPYLNSCATYTESNKWTEQDEADLLILLDKLNDKSIRFALSNNLKYGNPTLEEWMKKYNVHYLNADYSNCNYQKSDKSKDIEVLITNY